jgi:metal-responsive CopG/Arc/MetJ family transcriptional regulator
VRREMTKKVTIRIDLEGQMAERFTLLKQKRGLKNNSELVRSLITEEYQRQEG